MSRVAYLAPLVEITEFQWALIVIIAAVGMLVVPSYEIRFPPAVNLTLWVSVFWGRMAQTILAYVTFLCFGTLLRWMKKMVFLPFILLYPCANQPSSLHIPLSQMSLSAILMRSLYLRRNGGLAMSIRN